jgi:transcriptional regulator with GAF, ATPase, and Fis domain
VPMVVRDEIIGAAYVDGRGASSFNSEDLEYLVSFAQLAAIAVENARLLEKLRAENLYLRKEVETRYQFENLIGKSAAMERVTSLIEKVARTPASVIIFGETGTGKELVARAIHYSSDRRSRPFVTVDCGALPENLLESELFGHRRGAFSGAIHDRVGLFEEADGGTLFLDEVTNTSLDLQVKLLRSLQEGEVRRVGENLVRKVNVRIIAASNVDVRSAVEDGKFREDLFYRLNVVGIEVPPLRKRREDVPLLAQHFLKRSCARLGKEIAGFTEEGMRFLMSAPWRGNVRELENLVERAVILAEKDRLDAAFLQGLLPPAPRTGAAEAGGRPVLLTKEEASRDSAPAGEAEALAPQLLSLEEFDSRWLEAEKRYLEDLIKDCGGNLAEAARRAQVKNRNTLISRLKKHGLR